jgi:hypothetical protein
LAYLRIVGGNSAVEVEIGDTVMITIKIEGRITIGQMLTFVGIFVGVLNLIRAL